MATDPTEPKRVKGQGKGQPNPDVKARPRGAGRQDAPRSGRSRFVASERQADQEPPAGLKKLSQQHELFCLEFIRLQSAVAAYRAAGYLGEAKQNAWKMRHDPLIAARISELMAEKFKALHMDVDEILGRLALLARSNIQGLLTADGLIVDLNDIDDGQAYAIAGIDVLEERDQEGNAIGYTKKVRLRDPTPALRMLAEHKKLIGTPADQVNQAIVAIADRLKAARERARAATPATTTLKEPKP